MVREAENRNKNFQLKESVFAYCREGLENL